MNTINQILLDRNFPAIASAIVLDLALYLVYIRLTRPRHGYKHYHYLEG